MAERKKIGLIGAGRFGCFWGAHLSKLFPVRIYDIDPRNRKKTAEFAQWSTLPGCLECDLIVLAIPIRAIPDFLQTHAQQIPPGRVVMDCASVKTVVAEWFEAYLPAEVSYLLTHPLFGPDSAADGLEGKAMTVIPGRIAGDRLDFLIRFFSDTLGLQVHRQTAEEHDRLMAGNLALMHHLGRALFQVGITELPLKMASLEKAAEIARTAMNDTRELFEDFYRFNPFAREVEAAFIRAFLDAAVR